MAKVYPGLSKGSGSSSCSPEMPGLYPWQCVRPAWIPGASLELHRSEALSASQASPTHKGATFRPPMHYFPLPQTFPSCFGGEGLLQQLSVILLLVRLGGLSHEAVSALFRAMGSFWASSLMSLPLSHSSPGQLGKSMSRMRDYPGRVLPRL